MTWLCRYNDCLDHQAYRIVHSDEQEERGRTERKALVPREGGRVALSSTGRLGRLMHFLYSFNGHS